jgi:hypothetical protein
MRKLTIILLIGIATLSGCANNSTQAFSDRQILCPDCDKQTAGNNLFTSQQWFFFGMTNGRSFTSPTVIAK